MNFFCSIIILFNFSIVFAQHKNHEITYKVFLDKELFISHAEKILTDNPDKKDTVDEIINNADDIYFSLIIQNNTISVYEKIEFLENESQSGINIANALTSGYYVYNDYNKKNILTKNKYFDSYLVKRPRLKWELVNETKYIGEYLCYKATTQVIYYNKGEEINKFYEVWYSPDINIPFGPDIFSGLPGLIMEVTNLTNFIKYTVVNIKKSNSVKIIEHPKGTEITESELDKLILDTKNRLRN